MKGNKDEKKQELKSCFFVLVPSARLELAKLSPLPPQDSVSTNFTTTASIIRLDYQITLGH